MRWTKRKTQSGGLKMPRSSDGMLKKYGKLNHARNCYGNKMKEARERDIPFYLTFQQYYEWFLDHGIDKNIPQKNDKNAWCMCRYNDTGPYELENIYLDTMSNNSKFAHVMRKEKGIKYSNPNKGKSPLIITPDGMMTVVEASKKYNISVPAIRWRVKNMKGYEYAS